MKVMMAEFLADDDGSVSDHYLEYLELKVHMHNQVQKRKEKSLELLVLRCFGSACFREAKIRKWEKSMLEVENKKQGPLLKW